jgi:anaerobic selenocysteine-containing dehydrogenase
MIRFPSLSSREPSAQKGPVRLGMCSFCDSGCGIEVRCEGEKVLSIAGDRRDVRSRGHVCPKAMALQDLQDDPDRLRRPVRRSGAGWVEVTWDEALDEFGRRVASVQQAHSPDAAALYYGNPLTHDYRSLLALPLFIGGLGTRNIYSASSVDTLARFLVSAWMYGNQALVPVPDLERTSFLLIVGANPLVSGGSVMTAPDTRRRLAGIRSRGGKIVVVDPRRTETAAAADEHLFIRPGADALLFLAMLETIFREGLTRTGKLGPMIGGLGELRRLAALFPARRVEGAVGIAAADIEGLARSFAAADSAACYGRMGISTQAFAALATWLADALNIVTGNLDRAGGAMFATPAVDLVAMARLLGRPGRFGRWGSRVCGLPEFEGELPVAALADEIETEGPGQIRALLVHAGNPALSLPDGRRIERALERLEFLACIDFYVNETSRHAHLILPPVTPLEHDHYPLVESQAAVRNAARYAPAVLTAPPGARCGWEIQLDLLRSLDAHRRGLSPVLGRLAGSAAHSLGPCTILDLLLRLGPHRMSLRRLLDHPRGIDLGPLRPRLAEQIGTPDRRICLAPPPLVRDAGRLEALLSGPAARTGKRPLLLVTRRVRRNVNTWTHNLPRLAKGSARCTLQMSPVDASRLRLREGERVRVSSKTGSITVPLDITDAMMPGVVSLPLGWGHDRPGARLAVAALDPGASVNDLTDAAAFDRASCASVLDGIPVEVRPARPACGGGRHG